MCEGNTHGKIEAGWRILIYTWAQRLYCLENLLSSGCPTCMSQRILEDKCVWLKDTESKWLCSVTEPFRLAGVQHDCGCGERCRPIIRKCPQSRVCVLSGLFDIILNVIGSRGLTWWHYILGILPLRTVFSFFFNHKLRHMHKQTGDCRKT